MKQRKTINVPAPLAQVGDAVLALNYRRKSGEFWERATVSIVEMSVYKRHYSWSYRVMLDRRGPRDRYNGLSGYPIHLTVDDSQIRNAK